jgi:hypothetical protein
MRLPSAVTFSKVALVSLLTIVMSSCGRHAPPEETIRTLCEANIRKTMMAANPDSSEQSKKNVKVQVLEITRKGIGESKNTRDIPDKTLVYPIACLLQTTIDGKESEPETLFLYLFRGKDGDWLVRGRL